jgi:trimeric autotransporter adhesin
MKKIIVLITVLHLVATVMSQSWNINGNTGINSTINFLGTRNNAPLVFKVNNAKAGFIDSGTNNLSLGFRALDYITNGSNNVAIGFKALYGNSTGFGNTATGSSALQNNTTSSFNTAMGYSALQKNISGSSNTAMGSTALQNNTTGSGNAAMGSSSLQNNNTGSYNSAYGNASLANNTSGNYNTATGSGTLALNNTGNYNTATGSFSLGYNTIGVYNTATGSNSLGHNINGSSNTATGFSALSFNNGSSNTADGYSSLLSNTAGWGNTAMGSNALQNNTTGLLNTASGASSLFNNSAGNYNTAMGFSALGNTTASYYNTAVGYNSGRLYNLGYNNTILGANCDGSFPGQYNIIAIGQGVICPDNSTARIGNSATWSIGGYAGWSNFSDGRFKKDVNEEVKGLDFIMKLRPVTYHLDAKALSIALKENNSEEWNEQMKTAIAEKEKMLQTGFVAQEVEQAAKETGFDFSGIDKPRTANGMYALRYAEFVVPLVKAMQEQQGLIKELQEKVKKIQDQADITVVLRENIVTEKLSAYPNPASNNLTVIITTQTAGEGSLQFYDGAGRLVKQMNIDIRQGMNTINLSIPNLSAGYYNLKLDWGRDMHKQVSIVKQ